MTTAYTAVYDLLSQPEKLQPPYGFYAVWVFIAAIAVGCAVQAVRNEWPFTGVICFFAAVLVLANGSSLLDYLRFREARQAIVDGQYQTVEGCLDSYRPGRFPARRNGDERWRIGVHDFSYSPGQHGFGYDRVQENGGAVFADTRVRVAFLTYNGDNRIVRLEVAPHACSASAYTE